MLDFEFMSPTQFVFGRGVEEKVGGKRAERGAGRMARRRRRASPQSVILSLPVSFARRKRPARPAAKSRRADMARGAAAFSGNVKKL